MRKYALGTRVEIGGEHWTGRRGHITRRQKLFGYDYQVELDDGATIPMMAEELKVVEGKGMEEAFSRREIICATLLKLVLMGL